MKGCDWSAHQKPPRKKPNRDQSQPPAAAASASTEKVHISGRIVGDSILSGAAESSPEMVWVRGLGLGLEVGLGLGLGFRVRV